MYAKAAKVFYALVIFGGIYVWVEGSSRWSIFFFTAIGTFFCTCWLAEWRAHNPSKGYCSWKPSKLDYDDDH